jgi:hypothetical protein
LLFRYPCRDNNFRSAKMSSRYRETHIPMFVNDTTRLPDSGRVCVAAFRNDAAGNRTFYSLTIVAARAEVEEMTEPRNPAHVLGQGAFIDSKKGRVFAAYFAGSRARFDAEPNYKDNLYVLVDGAVYGVRGERIESSIRRGLTTREFTLMRGDRPQRSVKYTWPWYREPFANPKLGTRSEDFLREMSAMISAYG